MTTHMMIATVAWLLLSAGYVLRTRKFIHVALMHGAILLDMTLVVHLQLTRDAVQTAASFSLAWAEQAHILFSTIALLLYFPVLWLGWRLLFGAGAVSVRKTHIRLALSAYLFRTLGFGFMFSMWRV